MSTPTNTETSATVQDGGKDYPIEITVPVAKCLDAGLVAKASDWHLRTSISKIRVHGCLEPMPGDAGDYTLTNNDLLGLIAVSYSPTQAASFSQRCAIDLDWAFAWTYEDRTIRFRAHANWTLKGIKITLRRIPEEPPTMEWCRIPVAVQKIIKTLPKSGLFLIGGATNSGKSTAVAAMIRYLVDNSSKAAVSFEDPIEFVHEDTNGIVDQLEKGWDFNTYDQAFRSSMRNNPDIISYGELRDAETIEAAVTAAETGHLVFGTIHAKDATSLLRRVVDAVSKEKKELVRAQLAAGHIYIMCIKLIKSKKGARVPAYEVCIVNTAIATYIREWTPHLIKNAMDPKQGMQLMDHSIADLVRQGVITQEEGKSNANVPHEFDKTVRDYRP